MYSSSVLSAPAIAHDFSSFALHDTGSHTGVQTTLYLPSPPPERNPQLQVAPHEDESIPSSIGRIDDQTLGDEHAVTERPPGACARCKRLKVKVVLLVPCARRLIAFFLPQMKCTFTAQSPSCTRCQSGRHECTVEGRKPRTPG